MPGSWIPGTFASIGGDGTSASPEPWEDPESRSLVEVPPVLSS